MKNVTVIQDCGWVNLIDKMVKEIEREKPNLIVELYCKEKFGELRIEPSVYNEYLEIVIDKYEIMSQFICEECEKEGRKRNIDGWKKVLCDECYEEIE
jgi:hypothetical protein